MGCICEPPIHGKDQINQKPLDDLKQISLPNKQHLVEKFSYNILSNADTFEEEFYQIDFQINLPQTQSTLPKSQKQLTMTSLPFEMPKQEKINYINNLASLTAKYTFYEKQLKRHEKYRVKEDMALKGILKIHTRKARERTLSSNSDISQKTVKFSLPKKRHKSKSENKQKMKQMIISQNALKTKNNLERKRSQSTTK